MIFKIQKNDKINTNFITFFKFFMGAKYKQLQTSHYDFIAKQHIFFVSTASKDSLINLSPKDTNSLRILNNNKILWLNMTGSGNETAAHLQEDKRMTIMFCSFERQPMILRLYGKATTIYPNNKSWQNYLSKFDNITGVRQLFLLDIDMVMNSCGFGVPLYNYQGNRAALDNWAINKGETGLAQYRQEKNTLSLNNKKIIL